MTAEPVCARDIDLLFVYGTLRRASGSSVQKLLMVDAELIGLATYQGRLYLVDGYPGAVPSESCEDLVHGELFRLLNHQETLRTLDEYEECGDSFGLSTEYLREIATVRLMDGGVRNAWIYRYNRPTGNLKRIESGDFLRLQEDG